MPKGIREFVEAARNVAVAKPERVRSVFGNLRGTHQFAVQDARQPNNPSKFATLRLDPDNGLLSGDLFHDDAGQRWILSWRSDAIYVPSPRRPDTPWTFAAICATFFAPNENPRRFAKLFLNARRAKPRDGCGKLEVRLAVVDGKTEVYDLVSVADQAFPARHDRLFRPIRLYVDVESALQQDELYGPIIDRVIGKGHSGKGDLAGSLAEEQLSCTITSRRWTPSRRARTAGEAEDPVEAVAVMLADLPNRDDGSFTIILSSAEDEGDSDDIPLGRTLGIDALPKRFGGRRAAVVFPKEIFKSFERQRRRPPTLADEDELAYRLRFTILHELGHLLNLPHSWQRDAFADVRLTAEPAEPTWMQYGSLFPLGAAHDHFLESIEDDKKRRDRRDEFAGANFRKPKGRLLCARFSKQEQLHLFHAPHDQISAGGRTFVDAERQTLSMQSPSLEPALELAIEGAGPVDGATRITLADYVTLALQAKYQPPIGKVRFRQRDTNGDGKISKNMVFRFSSKSLVWLFREEFETMWSNQRPRREVVYEPNLSLLAPAMLHPRPNVLATEGRDNKGDFVDFEAPLPLLLPEFLFRRLDAGTRFTTQVAYLAPDGIHYSNQVQIVYERNDDPRPFGQATNAIVRLLSDEALPALAETALYFPRQPLDRLDGVPALKTALSDVVPPAREHVTKKLEALAAEGKPAPAVHPLAWLERLAAFVETRRFENDSKAGRPTPDPRTWRFVGSQTVPFLESQLGCSERVERFRKARSAAGLACE